MLKKKKLKNLLKIISKLKGALSTVIKPTGGTRKNKKIAMHKMPKKTSVFSPSLWRPIKRLTRPANKATPAVNKAIDS